MQTAARPAPKSGMTRAVIGYFIFIAIFVRALMEAGGHPLVGYVAGAVCGLIFAYNVFEIFRGQSTVMVIPSIAGAIAVVALLDGIAPRVLLIATIVAIDLLLLPGWSRSRKSLT